MTDVQGARDASTTPTVAAVHGRWATRLTWMIVVALLVAVFSLISLSLQPMDRLSSGLLWSTAWSAVSLLLVCTLLPARLVLAALRDAELAGARARPASTGAEGARR